MQTIDMGKNIKIGFDDLVQSVSRLNSAELTLFFDRLNRTISGQLLPFGEETILLKQIKAVIPASVTRRFKELQTKQNKGSITEKEQEEILTITDFIEAKSAERVYLLAALAKMRQVSLIDLVKQLQLKNHHA